MRCQRFLLVLELADVEGGTPAWRYAAARMTTGGVEMRLKDRAFFTSEWVHPTPTAFETWTFFFEPREE